MKSMDHSFSGQYTMASVPDDGPSHADTKQIAMNPTSGPLPPVDTVPSLSVREPDNAIAATSTPSPTNAGATLSSSSSYEYMSRFTSPRMREATWLKAYGSNNKGKGAQRSLDWQIHAARNASESEREELAYQLLASLPRSRLVTIQRRIVPLLQFDLIGSLPPELSLQIFALLPATALLNCALVCRRWGFLANDQTLWRNLCHARGWEWRPQRISPSLQQSEAVVSSSTLGTAREDRDEDEGMGDEEEGEDEGSVVDAEDIPNRNVGPDNEFTDHDFQSPLVPFFPISPATTPMPISRNNSAAASMIRTFSQRHALPSSSRTGMTLAADYKLLHQTQTLLRSRVRHGTYRLRTLPRAEGGGHSAAVYCLALWSYDSAYGLLQVLFTGSKDSTVQEWDLNTNRVRRKVVGMHASSVLSLCVTATITRVRDDSTCGSVDHSREGYKNSEGGILVSGGSDCRVVVWDLARFKLIKALKDHQDSVLCVRVDNGRLVSCSKDRTIRTYAFPDFKPELVLRGHRAAVNAVSIVGDVVVSGSGDRSVRVWDARTGALINNFEDHHARAISSVELTPPFILSGSSDKHVRMFHMGTKCGWSTCPEFDNPVTGQLLAPLMTQEGLGGDTPASQSTFFLHSSLSQLFQQAQQDPRIIENETRICSVCGARVASTGAVRGPERHTHPVRSVAVGDEFAVSGSYDCTVKVWDKVTGALVADLTGGHTGRIFCVAQDSTKIVSCGEDQRICVWDFSHGIDTSFIQL